MGGGPIFRSGPSFARVRYYDIASIVLGGCPFHFGGLLLIVEGWAISCGGI